MPLQSGESPCAMFAWQTNADRPPDRNLLVQGLLISESLIVTRPNYADSVRLTELNDSFVGEKRTFSRFANQMACAIANGQLMGAKDAAGLASSSNWIPVAI